MPTLTRILVLALLAGLAAAAVADEKSEADQKALAGNWEVISVELNGEKTDAPSGDDAQVEFKEGKVLNRQGELFRFKLDATTNPRLIDFTTLQGPDKDRVLEGIYKLDKDTLTICLWTGQGATSRPADFATKPGSNHALVVLQRK